MKAYLYDNLPVSSPHTLLTTSPKPEFQGDQRLPHLPPSDSPFTESDLSALGVLYFHMPSLADVDALAAARGYRNRDEIVVSPGAMGEVYEAKVRSFFAEHLHEDEEIRYVRGGRGYFDVRDREDRWVRIALEKVSFLFFSFFFFEGRGLVLTGSRMT